MAILAPVAAADKADPARKRAIVTRNRWEMCSVRASVFPRKIGIRIATPHHAGRCPPRV